MVGSVIRYIFIILIVIAMAASIVMLDGFLKCRQTGADGMRTFTSRHGLIADDNSYLGVV